MWSIVSEITKFLTTLTAYDIIIQMSGSPLEGLSAPISSRPSIEGADKMLIS